MTEAISDIQTLLEERFHSFLAPLLAEGGCWTGVGNQKGISDEAIKPPCIISYAKNDEEVLYATTVSKVEMNIQIQSPFKNTAETHKQRVATLERYLCSFDDGVLGSRAGLATQLTSTENHVHVWGVVAGPADNALEEDVWVYNRVMNVYCMWVESE